MFEGGNEKIFNVLCVIVCVHCNILYCFCIKLIKIK